MIPEWQRFLEGAGARVESGKTLGFGDTPPRDMLERAILCDLSHLGLIRARGEETAGFLQGQLSNDVAQVCATRSQFTSYCNPKGRMLAILRLFIREDDYYLRMPREILEPTLKRLRMFVLRAKVTLEDASEDLVGMGYAGAGADARLSSKVGALPQVVDGSLTRDGLTVIRIPGPQPRFELYGDLEGMKALWSELDAEALASGAADWALLDILCGIPTVLAGTREAFVPQMANLDRVDGLSFKKGCYPGQEIVARTHYLGKLKRRMYRLRIPQGVSPRPGDPVYGTAPEPVGTVVDAQPHPAGGMGALAVLRIDAASAGELHLGSPEGSPVTIQTLPYTL
jgi:hypothetical protein